MGTKKVDLLNIGLIIISAVLAYHFPVQLFILAFAILGPLHYLTEINWLDKQNYYTPSYNRLWLWIGATASFLIVFPKLWFHFAGFEDTSFVTEALKWFNPWTNALIFLSLALAAGFVFIKKTLHWMLLIVVSVGIALLLQTNETYTLLVGFFIPTVIHVYIFTLLFMIYGAKKAKSKFGYVAVALALFIPIMFVSVDIQRSSYEFSTTMKDIYLENRFHSTPIYLAKFMGISDGRTFYFYETMELRLMMFIAFIYLYHYLNWFSKTTVIQWHKTLTKKRSIAIVVLWTAMLSLFYFDFRLGFIVALFFSTLHVLLEFPLNIVSIRGIFSNK